MKSKGKGLYWLVIKSCKHSLYIYIKKTDERHYKALYDGNNRGHVIVGQLTLLL